MQIFLTGGTGFIGSHVINQAYTKGYSIKALRRTPNSEPRVPLQCDPCWIDKTMADLSPKDFSGCEAVVHLAAHSANVPYDSLENCIRENVLAPLQMFRIAIKSGIRRFIVAGSCFEFGRCGEREEFIRPDSGLEPVSSYPASKAAASVAFHALACEENLELLILRIFQVYGEGELQTRFWPSLRKAALAGENFLMTAGEQVRDFINVADVAARFVESIGRTDLKSGQPLFENVGSGHPLTLADFATQWWEKWDAKGDLMVGVLPHRKDEVMRFVPHIAATCPLETKHHHSD